MWMYEKTGLTRSFIACLIQSLFPPRKILVLISEFISHPQF